MAKNKQTEVPTIPPQRVSGYNRESGKKTLFFVTILLLAISGLTITVIYLVIQ